MSESARSPDVSRRGFVQRTLYVAPAVLTLSAAPSFAKAGSVKPGDGDGVGQGNGNNAGNGNGPGNGNGYGRGNGNGYGLGNGNGPGDNGNHTGRP